MKIKKVEIQAFRAYDRVEDGTFDFKRTEDGLYADFISLYAPNGFGKTSFYDAIEYGYTNNIDRLLKNKNNKDIAKSGKNIANTDKQFILRNRSSDIGLQSFIKLSTSKSADSVVKNIAIPRKGASDFKFEEKDTENSYFREVILSQDWISGFLKEDKPEDRYRTFMEYFGDKELDKYYTMLSDLIALNIKEIKVLQKDFKDVQLELKFDGDQDVLSKVNEKVNSLNENFKFLNTIDFNSSESDILNITNSISERLSTIDFEITKNQQVISSLNILVHGQDHIISFSQFKDSLKKLAENLKKQEELNSVKQKFQDVQRKNIEKKALQENSKNLLSQKEKKQRIAILIKEYKEVKTKIENKQKDLNGVLSEYELIRTKISSEKIDQSGLEIKTSDYEKQIENINKTLIQLPELAKNIIAIESKIKKFNVDLDLKNIDLKNESDQIEVLESYMRDLQTSLNNIKLTYYPSEFDLNFVKYTDSLNKIKDIEFKIKKAKEDLQLIEDDIFQQESFQSELESFIAKGLSIVNEKKADSCPLCSQQYDSYNLLADKIANNESLSNFLNVLLSKKTNVQVEINQLLDTLEKLTGILVKEITKDFDVAELRVADLNKKNLETRKEILNLNNDIKNETANLVRIKDQVLYKSSEEYIDWASVEIERLSSELALLIKQLADRKDELKKNTDNNESNAKKIEQYKNDKKDLELNAAYIEVKDFFIESYPEKEITVEIVNEDIEKDVKKQEEFDKSIEKIDIEITGIESELVGLNEIIVNANLEKVAESIVSLSSITEYYKNNAAKIDGLNFEEIEPEEFHQLIIEKRLAFEMQIVKYDEEKKDLKLLSQLKDNVLPYLKFEESKQKASDIKKRISVLKDKVGVNLKNELSKVSKHIEKQIKSFFFEDLINELYKRIDPHPDYRKVKFKPDFKEAKPKLNVCVYNENDETDFIIPNLYFSHAQLNILSLCIFLAKALNAKDDKDNAIDCIFVDDPIQSMDSINILSTIDLLRSIVVNQKKQIILSTHDENFHNLLKKKIPANLFNSKFMELETFGKIKLD